VLGVFKDDKHDNMTLFCSSDKLSCCAMRDSLRRSHQKKVNAIKQLSGGLGPLVMRFRNKDHSINIET